MMGMMGEEGLLGEGDDATAAGVGDDGRKREEDKALG